MPDVELARRPGVELVKTGSWGILTGSWNPNRDDILAAVEAAKCPAVRRPRIKIGHLDPRFNKPDELGKEFDGTPALGWFENLRAADDGNTLIADQVALPWLTGVQAAAYPDRSIEGNYRQRCALGHVHPFVIKAVSLLGETEPGIPTLRSIDDLPGFLGVAAGSEPLDEGRRVEVTIRAAVGDVNTGAMVALIPTAADAARLAVEGGEPAEELHVTLAYLGEAAELGVSGRQDVIDGVSRAANGLPQFEAEAFSVNVFNPPGATRGDGKDRSACLVLGLSGNPIDAVHDLVSEALAEALWANPTPMAEQHRPWHCHMTLLYSDDLSRIAELTSRIGPVTFDRIRLAFAGEVIDIPLIPAEEIDAEMVAASAADDIRSRTARLREARTAREASVAASEPPTTALPPDPAPPTEPLKPPTEAASSILPAAEPEPENTDPKEDLVSTDLSAFRSRLGLSDDADIDAITTAIDELKTKADTPPAPAEPTPEMVAASAAAVEEAKKAEQEKSELAKEVSVLASQVQLVTTELAAAKAAEAATVKQTVIQAAADAGKFTPADREQWEKDYDEAPGAITRVLASIAPGTAVPVMASGVTGPAEPEVNVGLGVSDEALDDWAKQLGVDSKELSH